MNITLATIERLAVTSWNRHKKPLWDNRDEWRATGWEFFGIARAGLYTQAETHREVARFLSDIAHERARML